MKQRTCVLEASRNDEGRQGACLGLKGQVQGGTRVLKEEMIGPVLYYFFRLGRILVPRQGI